ncbi:hypothetical protein PMAC_000699 [Pneumocystis sp. 'macacae']|nr:hypothetical protein PMAC_000699 [Pneumocystis sp. 'macacae']
MICKQQLLVKQMDKQMKEQGDFQREEKETEPLKRPVRPISLAYRDSCMSLLEELNYCRENSWYLPWKCNEERHSRFFYEKLRLNKLEYEKCQYEAFKERVKKMNESKR